MKNEAVHIQRRKFLKTGASGGLVAAVFPLSELTAGFADVINPCDREHRNIDGSDGKLVKIIRRYGSEFGQAGKEY